MMRAPGTSGKYDEASIKEEDVSARAVNVAKSSRTICCCFCSGCAAHAKRSE